MRGVPGKGWGGTTRAGLIWVPPGPPPGSPGRFLAFNGGQPHFQAISVTPEAMDRASLHNKVATVLTVSAHSP